MKRKARRPTLVTRAEMVTSEFLQHHAIADVVVVHLGDSRDIKPHRALAKRNMTQRPIDQYHYQHNISDAQYLAAERFYADWYLMGITPRQTANYTGVGGGGGPNHGSDRQQAARSRHNEAMNVLDMYDQGFVIDVVCYDIYLGGQMMKNRITVKTRFDRLRDALDRLARHYGIG